MQALPQTMRAAVYHAPRKLEVEERPVPEIGPGDVLIEVSHCGVCGTDLHVVLEGMGRPGMVGGHEYSGRLAAVGSDVSGWEAGDWVVARPGKPACGNCDYCRVGRRALCEERDVFGGEVGYEGAFAQYARVRAEQLVRIPQGLSPRAAALAEPFAVVLHAIHLSGVAQGERVLISGAGPIGTFTLAALRAQGVEDITVSEPSPVRRSLAETIGASQVVGPDALEPPAMPFDQAPDAYHVVFECSGQPSAMETGLALLRRGGRLMIVGTGMKRPKLDHNRVLLNELIVMGAYTYDDDGFERALELLASGKVPTDLLVESEDVSLDGMLTAMERLSAGKTGGKVLITPR